MSEWLVSKVVSEEDWLMRGVVGKGVVGEAEVWRGSGEWLGRRKEN